MEYSCIIASIFVARPEKKSTEKKSLSMSERGANTGIREFGGLSLVGKEGGLFFRKQYVDPHDPTAVCGVLMWRAV